MKEFNETILVIGGGGKNGSRVVKKLRDKGYHVISTNRKFKDLKEGERFFDWNDTSTFDLALKDVSKVYIIHPDTSIPMAYDQIKQLVVKLTERSVKKAVLLSGRGQDSVRKCEEILMNSALNWTIVRSAWFNQNFSEGHFLHGIRSGEVVFMADTVKEPFVDLDDLSDVVVESLLDDRHNRQVYEVTGDELLSFEDAVKVISLHLSNDIKYHFLPKLDYQQLLKTVGLDQFTAEHMTQAFEEILDGRNENMGDGIQKVLGRNPRKFAEFVASNQF